MRVHELIAAYFLPIAAVGYIRLGWRFIDLISQLAITPFVSVALPTLSRAAELGAGISQMSCDLQRLAAIAAFPCFAGLAVISPILIPFVLGDQWVPAVLIVQILCLIGPPLVSNSFSWPILISAGKAGSAAKLALIQLSIGSLLSLLAAPFGLIFVLGSHVLRSFVLWPVTLNVVARRALFLLRYSQHCCVQR
jgi:O-antigen/teichoic acid export membrane protein